jgi:hypothetical protein
MARIGSARAELSLLRALRTALHEYSVNQLATAEHFYPFVQIFLEESRR